MGMMDGGINFRDICHKCNSNENGVGDINNVNNW